MRNYLNTSFDSAKIPSMCDEIPIWSAPFGLKLLDSVQYKRNINVLDIGFGSGFPLLELALRLGNSCTVYGMDIWTEAINRAKEKAAFYNLSNIKIIESKAESIPLEDNFFDLITSNNGINNVSNIARVLHECFRTLKPGGQFIQTMNLPLSMFEFYSELELVLKEMGLEKEVELMNEHIAHKRPSVDFMIKEMKSVGFLIKDITYDQFNYHFSDGTAMLNHYFIRLAFMSSWCEFLPKDKLDEIFDKVETGLNKYATLQGSLKLSIPFILIDATKE